nr:NAD(P)H-dependent oxidoreductase [Kibdelosporangium phytohabitans]
MVTANVLVIHHSRKGTLHALATAAAEGARAAGATVRLRRIDAPGEPPPTKDDLLWADGIVWGSPTFYGNVSAPVKQFIDSTSDLWRARLLADKVVTGMTSSTSLNGGQEATLLGLYRSMYHWGAAVMSADSTMPLWAETGANPYGVSVCANGGDLPSAVRDAAAHTGARITRLAHLVRTGEPAPSAKIVVICQDGRPALRALAAAVASGARETGAAVRLRQITPATTDVPVVTPADVSWADGLAWGMPATTGSLPAMTAGFVETVQDTGADFLGRTVTAFGTTSNAHAGGESTLLAAYTAMHAWDCLIVAPGYTDPVVTAAGGNPYGTLSHDRNGPPLRTVLAAARHQGRRLALLTSRVRGGMLTVTSPRVPARVPAEHAPSRDFSS